MCEAGFRVQDSGSRAPLIGRDAFPLLRRHPELVYLDSAATAHKPDVVLDAVRDFYERDYANPHRGAYALSVRATDRYQAARARVARFLGAADAETLVFTRGTTESLNLVAGTIGRATVRPDDEIIVTGAEHHANFVPWQRLAQERGARFRIAELRPDGQVDLAALRALLSTRTRIVAFHHISNVLGTVAPVREIAALAHSVGAIAVCDGAQGAPHLPLCLDELGVDFYAASGHKMLGPMGIGVLVGRRELLERMPPFLSGGDMIEFVYDDHSTWNVLPHKFEAGTPDAAGAVGLAAAAELLDTVGMEAVAAHGRALAGEAHERLAAIDGVQVFGPPATERSSIVSFAVRDVHPHDLATILDERHVCIRAGHHCAQPLMRRLGVAATARASFSVYNESSDIDALIAGVTTAKELFRHAAV